MNNFENAGPSEQELRIKRARRARVVKRIVWIAIPLVLVITGVGVAIQVRNSDGGDPGVAISDQGRDHVPLNATFSYNSNPPTSGPHNVNPAEWGVYHEEIHDQIFIHNLEHGGIWIAYKPGIDEAVKSKLEAIAKDYGRKVIMAPRSANDSDVALAAWNHLDKFSASEFSEERVRNFIKAYRNKGPEFVP